MGICIIRVSNDLLEPTKQLISQNGEVYAVDDYLDETCLLTCCLKQMPESPDGSPVPVVILIVTTVANGDVSIDEVLIVGHQVFGPKPHVWDIKWLSEPQKAQ